MKHLIALFALVVSAVCASAQVDANLVVKKSDLNNAVINQVYSTDYKIFYAVDLSDMDKATQEYFKERIYKSSIVFPATVVNEENIWVLGSMKSLNQEEVLSHINSIRSAALAYGSSTPANVKNQVIVK